MTGLFRRVAQQVAERLGYPFPDHLIDGVIRHVHRMRAGDFSAGPLDTHSGGPAT